MEQWESALDEANRVRTVCAELLQEVRKAERKDALMTVSNLFTEYDKDPNLAADYGALRVGRILQSIPRVGAQRAGQVLRKAQISPERRLRNIPDFAKHRIASQLQEIARR